jgi:hypothetical protein
MESEQGAGWYPDPTGSSDLRYWDGSQWTEHTAAANKNQRTGAWIALSGLLVAISPILMAFFLGLTQGTSMWSEGGEGAGTALWLMFFSVPVGSIIITVGLVVGAANSPKKLASGRK